MSFYFSSNNSSSSGVDGEYIESKTSPTSWALAITTKFLLQESYYLSSFETEKSAGFLFIPFFKIFSSLIAIEVVVAAGTLLVGAGLPKAELNAKLGSNSIN